jgi:hypothetical protein
MRLPPRLPPALPLCNGAAPPVQRRTTRRWPPQGPRLHLPVAAAATETATRYTGALPSNRPRWRPQARGRRPAAASLPLHPYAAEMQRTTRRWPPQGPRFPLRPAAAAAAGTAPRPRTCAARPSRMAHHVTDTQCEHSFLESNGIVCCDKPCLLDPCPLPATSSTRNVNTRSLSNELHGIL